MSAIVLDAGLRAKLNGLNETMEVQDEAGKVVGHFVPHEKYNQMLCKTIEIPFSKEEIERMRKSGSGSSLAEFWKKMGVQ